jgi:hypothetical protein
MKSRDQLLLEQAYLQVLSEAPLDQAKNLMSKVLDIVKQKYPDFYNKLVGVKDNPQEMAKLIQPYLKGLNPTPVQEEAFGDVLQKGKEMFQSVLSKINLQSALDFMFINVGKFLISFGILNVLIQGQRENIDTFTIALGISMLIVSILKNTIGNKTTSE